MTRTILVAAALRDRARHDAALALLRSKVKPGTSAVGSLDPPPDGPDWNAIRSAEGGWDGIGPWVARAFDGLCVVPMDGATGLSRIVFAMARETLRAGKPVLAIQESNLLKVRAVKVTDSETFKGVFGVYEKEKST